MAKVGSRIVIGLLLAAPLGCAKDAITPSLAPGLPDAQAGTPDAVTGPADAGATPGDTAVPLPLPPVDAGATGCDLSGRWLVAQRVLASAIGQSQAAHNWFYYEIAQTGGALLVKKGLHCGFEVKGVTPFAASVDSKAAWPAFLMRNTSTGRAGQSAAAAGGCQVSFAREYVVRGATVAAYSDPAVPLPSAAQKAEGATPGWEDWDQDGQPGVSYKVRSTLAGGTLYVCQRDWTEYTGNVAPGASKWMLAVKYAAEQKPLGRAEGSPAVLETPADPASDPEEHRVWFHRLAAGQATGDDASVCEQIRALAPTLLPEAND